MVKRVNVKRIDAFDMFCYRCMLPKRTSVFILAELKIEQRQSLVVKKRILTFFGYFMGRPRWKESEAAVDHPPYIVIEFEQRREEHWLHASGQ